ncbi:MAG: flippase-like domain-containing protein [Acidimicrobiales bacterium]|nr:flippase-like domain-containing protein [Acidimicrobiales bacterium]
MPGLDDGASAGASSGDDADAPEDPAPVRGPGAAAGSTPSTRWSIWRALFLLASLLTLYVLFPRVAEVLSSAPELRTVKVEWFAAIAILMACSFLCSWALTRCALPQVSWFVAGTAQLVSNAVTKVIPAGAAVGGAALYRMLSVAGIEKAEAGSTLAATSLISTATLSALPVVAVGLAFFGAPIPQGLLLVAWGGGILFLLLFGIGFVLVTTQQPLIVVGGWVERIGRWVAAKRHWETYPRAEGFVEQRDRVVAALGPRWKRSLAASVGNWTFDYLALVAALRAVGASPRMSAVLLAYGAAAVLSMIPITPGGLGFVEGGLVACLTLAGVEPADALLATLAFRLFSYWLPLPAGLVAYLAFRRRYGPLGQIPMDDDDSPSPLAPATP